MLKSRLEVLGQRQRKQGDAHGRHPDVGKSQGLEQPYPLMGYLLDTAVIAGAIWEAVLTPFQRAAIASVIGLEMAAAKRVVMFWAGLHDLGKITPQFQDMLIQDRPERGAFLAEETYAHDRAQDSKAKRLRHELATNQALPQLLAGLGYPASGWVEALHEVLGCPEVPSGAAGALGSGRKMPVALAVVVAGLVIVSDWLASQEHAITAQQHAMEAASGGLGTPASPQAHGQRARAMAPGLESDAGLGRAAFHDRPFEGLFPEIKNPYPLQASLQAHLPAAVNMGHGPGVLLVTAPPGDGKTEAALYAATVMAAKYASGGLILRPAHAGVSESDVRARHAPCPAKSSGLGPVDASARRRRVV
ncbi:HD domain-containing protein [Streptomyces scopuliridis]|uniref:HD domain-containing protein n=1 Tax=Streptomyces scopuliridis TaxID=452529 RepID=UPI00367D20D0